VNVALNQHYVGEEKILKTPETCQQNTNLTSAALTLTRKIYLILDNNNNNNNRLTAFVPGQPG